MEDKEVDEEYAPIKPIGQIVEEASEGEKKEYLELIAKLLVERINWCMSPVYRYDGEEAAMAGAMETRDPLNDELLFLQNVVLNPLAAIKTLSFGYPSIESYSIQNQTKVFVNYCLSPEQATEIVDQVFEKIGMKKEDVRTYYMSKVLDYLRPRAEQEWPQ